MPFPSQGFSATSSSSRLSPQTVMSAVTLKTTVVANGTVIDVNSIPNKSITIKLSSTGTISDYLVKVTALSSEINVAANFSEITSEIYEENGIYHWSLEDSGRYFRIDAQQLGTADNDNYCTVTIIVEGTT